MQVSTSCIHVDNTSAHALRRLKTTLAEALLQLFHVTLDSIPELDRFEIRVIRPGQIHPFASRCSFVSSMQSTKSESSKYSSLPIKFLCFACDPLSCFTFLLDPNFRSSKICEIKARSFVAVLTKCSLFSGRMSCMSMKMLRPGDYEETHRLMFSACMMVMASSIPLAVECLLDNTKHAFAVCTEARNKSESRIQ